MNNILFKQITDIQECLGILDMFSDCLKSLRESSQAERLTFAQKFINNGIVILAQNEIGNAMGFLAYYANDNVTKTAFISMIAVLPQYRENHIGSALIDACASDCAKRGMRSLKLEVSTENIVAKQFYKKMDFSPKGDYSTCKILLEKEIV